VPVAHELHYELLDQESIFAVTFQHRKDGFMLDFGEAGAYHRFLGDVTFRHVIKGQVATFSGQTMWELLFFGARPDIAPGRSSGSDRMPLITHQA
jgi:hypothetical protein